MKRMFPASPHTHLPRTSRAMRWRRLPRARRERRRQVTAGTHHQSMISWILRSTESGERWASPNAVARLSPAIFVAQFLYDLNVR